CKLMREERFVRDRHKYFRNPFRDRAQTRRETAGEYGDGEFRDMHGQKLQRNIKLQTPNMRHFGFDVWSFSGAWSLELGAFITNSSVSSPRNQIETALPSIRPAASHDGALIYLPPRKT